MLSLRIAVLLALTTNWITEVQAREDVTPPIIESVQLVPEKIEIGGENSTLFVSVTVSDESDIDWAASDLWLVEPGNNFRFINFEQESSDPKVGKIELKFTSNDPSGDWEIRRVRVKDIYNQGREIQANSANPVDPLQKSLSELGVPETLTVSGGRDDTTPPYIESVQFVPEKIEIGGENSTLFVSVTVSDESDIDWAASDLWLVEPGNNFRFINFEQESSDPKVGKIELKFTSNDPSGDWEIRRVRVKDIYNQGREIQANSANPVDPLQKSLSELGVAQLLSIAVADTDGDGTNNIEDIDDDDDGVVDANDAFPLDANESKDTDNDGTGNNADEDDDGDGISDSQEIADDTDPLNRNSCATCFSLDVDSNGEISALTDGLLIIRHMFGFTGESLTAGALTSDSPITSPDEITQSLTDAKVLDVDDDGEIKALTDGLLAIRYLFGFTGESLTANAVGANALRADAEEIISYLGKFRSVKFNSKKLVIATGASVSIVNSVAQNGSQFSMQIINYTDFDVELVKFTQESDAGQVLLSKTDPDLLGGDMLLEPSESTTITLTIGAFGQSLPFTTNFYYINPETKKEEKKSYEWKVQ